MRRAASQALALTLASLLPAPGLAQAAGLRILVVEGEGAIHNIQLGSGREAVVEVRDESDRPVADAKVTFTLPDTGPSGNFFGSSRKITVPTNAQGRATATGFRPNTIQGRFQLLVSVAAGEKTATAAINQSNVLPTGAINRAGPRKRGWGTKVALLVAAGAAAGIAAAVAGGDDKETPTITGTTITPGTVTAGVPR